MPPRRRRSKDPRGRKPAVQSVRANWVGPKGRTVRFALSADVFEELKTMHLATFAAAYGLAVSLEDPLRHPRAEVLRLDSVLEMNAVLLRIEPPSFNPRGVRMRRDPKGYRWFVEVPARAIGVHPNMLPHDIPFLFDPKRPEMLGGAMVLVLPEEVMKPRRKPRDPRPPDPRQKWAEFAVPEGEE